MSDFAVQPERVIESNVSMQPTLWNVAQKVAQELGISRSRMVRVGLLQFLLSNVACRIEGEGVFHFDGSPVRGTLETPAAVISLSRDELNRVLQAL